jgi:hypothetical protein
VPQVVEAKARNILEVADKVCELVRQAAGLVRLAVGTGAN